MSEKDRKEVIVDLRRVYQAVDEAQALRALGSFEEKWGRRYGHIPKKWRESWLELTAFLGLAPRSGE